MTCEYPEKIAQAYVAAHTKDRVEQKQMLMDLPKAIGDAIKRENPLKAGEKEEEKEDKSSIAPSPFKTPVKTPSGLHSVPADWDIVIVFFV